MTQQEEILKLTAVRDELVEKVITSGNTDEESLERIEILNELIGNLYMEGYEKYRSHWQHS